MRSPAVRAEDDETGEVVFENAATWMAVMKWPRLPTLEEALQWQVWATSKLYAEIF